MPAAIRGNNVKVRIIVDGQPLDLDEVTSFEASSNSEIREDNYVGRPDPEIDVLEKGWSGSLSFLVKNQAVDTLLASIIQRRRSRQSARRVHIVVIEDYGPVSENDVAVDGVESFAKIYIDCQLTYSNMRTGGVDEKVTKAINFTSASMKTNTSP